MESEIGYGKHHENIPYELDFMGSYLAPIFINVKNSQQYKARVEEVSHRKRYPSPQEPEKLGNIGINPLTVVMFYPLGIMAQPLYQDNLGN